MQKKYHMDDAFVKAHFLRFGILLVLSILSAGLILFLGLKRWSADQYPMVNVGLLASTALAVWSFVSFGGKLDGKENPKKLSLITAGIAVGAALVIWVVLQILQLHHDLALVIFLANLVLVVLVLRRTWGILSNFVSGLLSTSDGEGNEVTFPGHYVLENVHVNDAITSPMGTVLINANTVMFVLTNTKRGEVVVTPGNTIKIVKSKFFKSNEYKEISLPVSSLLFNAEEGTRRIKRLVEESCAQRGISAPSMNYNFCLFMPRFQRGNLAFTENAFRNYGSGNAYSSYKKYLRSVSEFDEFSGRAAFNTWDLQNMLHLAGVQSGDAPSDPKLIAEILSEACHLKPAEK